MAISVSPGATSSSEFPITTSTAIAAATTTTASATTAMRTPRPLRAGRRVGDNVLMTSNPRPNQPAGATSRRAPPPSRVRVCSSRPEVALMSDRLMGKSAYEGLGVPADASEAALKRAYRHRMRQTHPDLGGDPEAFLLVQEAWAQVATAQLRAEHDRRRRGAPVAVDDERVWTSGRPDRRGRAQTWGASRSNRSRARSHGHPGGWSRERYLTLIREWAGRGTEVPDPYAPSLVRRAPRELRLLLADAIAEEATATALSELRSAYTLWHDVATGAGRGVDAGLAKIDNVVLGPTGLFDCM